MKYFCDANDRGIFYTLDEEGNLFRGSPCGYDRHSPLEWYPTLEVTPLEMLLTKGPNNIFPKAPKPCSSFWKYLHCISKGFSTHCTLLWSTIGIVGVGFILVLLSWVLGRALWPPDVSQWTPPKSVEINYSGMSVRYEIKDTKPVVEIAPLIGE